MIQQKRVREKLKLIAVKEALPFSVVEKITESPFHLLKISMETATRGKPETFKGIQVMGLGKFISKPNRHKKFKNG